MEEAPGRPWYAPTPTEIVGGRDGVCSRASRNEDGRNGRGGTVEYGDFEDLVVEVREGIGHFRINRAERLNALRTSTFWEVVELGRRLQLDDDVRVVVCTHEGRGFSSGADLSARNPADPDRAPEATPTDSMGVATIGMAMPGIDKPTIASINGVCAGAGFAFATSFDIRFLGPSARFVTVFARRALGPDCGLTYWLPRLVGPAKALELLYTSREVEAEEASRIGLGNALVDDPDAAAFDLARTLVEGPPLSYLWSKREVHHSYTSDLQRQIEFEWMGQSQLRHSEDVKEGRAVFLEKRPPQFMGR
ncbi:MAG: enoyl-CoA hydratase [Dehalococcoidia bacterium]|nr:enoyl-CoA hydratase [Dehalococcoidia bacterium]